MNKNEIKFLLENIPDLKTFVDEPLSRHSTYSIGGPADFLVIPQSLNSLNKVLTLCDKNKFQHFVIGSASNILFPDEGLQKIIIKLDSNAKFLNYIKVISKPTQLNKKYIVAGAATPKSELIKFAIENECSGFHFLAGIPGTLGGGLKMNAGTYDGKYQDVVKNFTTIDLKGNKKEYKNNHDLFSYRKLHIPPDEIITDITFYLRHGKCEEIKNSVEEIKSLRKQKHPINFPNCGSVFKNPPHAPAGVLIEKNKLKGYTIGNAQVSKQHCNFIVNLGGASAKDVKEIINHVKAVILQNEQIVLEEEVIIL